MVALTPMRSPTCNYQVRINHIFIELKLILEHNRNDGYQALLGEIADRHQATIVNDLGDEEE